MVKFKVGEYIRRGTNSIYKVMRSIDDMDYLKYISGPYKMMKDTTGNCPIEFRFLSSRWSLAPGYNTPLGKVIYGATNDN